MRSATPSSRRAEQEVCTATFTGGPRSVEPDLQHVHQELRELVDPGGQGFGLGLQRMSGEQAWVMVPQHAGAGARGHHHGQVFGKQAIWRAATARASSR